MREEIIKEVIGYFSGKLPIADLSEDEQMNYQWVGDGTLDSLAVLEAITAFEDKFDIRFDNDQMMDLSFERLGGLVSAIEAQKAG